jgi:hypothetical protein
MDTASRMQRAKEQGYDVDNQLYHGSTHDIKAFDSMAANPGNDIGRGVYMSDSVHDVNKNYAGEGIDLRSQITMLAEEYAEKIEYDGLDSLIDDLDASLLSDDLAAKWRQMIVDEGDLAADVIGEDIATLQLKGPNDGVVYPLLVKTDGWVGPDDNIVDGDFYEQAREAISEADYDTEDEYFDALNEFADDLALNDERYVGVNQAIRELGIDDINITPDYTTYGDLRDQMSGHYGYIDTRRGEEEINGGALFGEMLRRADIPGYKDHTTPERFSKMEAGNHYIAMPGHENQIRSTNAAFDPDYKGANLLGNATPEFMALLAAGGAGATAAGSESNAVTEATSRIVNHMLDNVTEVTDLLEVPQRGIQGLLRAGYGLVQGDGLDTSLNAGADVVNQGVEATAKQAGDAMLEKTGNPELAAMAYTAVMLGSPL